jgi:hypothetical protein
MLVHILTHQANIYDVLNVLICHMSVIIVISWTKYKTYIHINIFFAILITYLYVYRSIIYTKLIYRGKLYRISSEIISNYSLIMDYSN